MGRNAALARRLVLLAPLAGALAAAWAVQTLLALGLLGPSSVFVAGTSVEIPVGALLRSGIGMVLLLLNGVGAALLLRSMKRASRSRTTGGPRRRRPGLRVVVVVACIGAWAAGAVAMVAISVQELIPPLSWLLVTLPGWTRSTIVIGAQFSIFPWAIALASLPERAVRGIPGRRAPMTMLRLAAVSTLLACGGLFLWDAIDLAETFASEPTWARRFMGERLISMLWPVAGAVWNYGIPLLLCVLAAVSLTTLRHLVQLVAPLSRDRHLHRRLFLVRAPLMMLSLLAAQAVGVLGAAASLRPFLNGGNGVDDGVMAIVAGAALRGPVSTAQAVVLPLIVPIAWIVISWIAERMAYAPMSSAQRSGFSR